MSVLFLNVCSLCVSNSLGVCLKKIAPRQSWCVCAWYSLKIRVILGVRFERRKGDKKANLHENWSTETLF